MKNLLLILALFVVGCATMNYSPQNIAEKSFSDLCFSLQTGYDFPTFKALNQNSMDIVWEEIKKNKNRCDKGMYPGLTRAKIKSLNEHFEAVARRNRMLGAMFGSLSDSLSGNNSSGTSGYYQNDYVDGFNKICYYDTINGREAYTIPSTSICPLSPPNSNRNKSSGSGFFVDDSTDGFNKICYYDTVSGREAYTISSTSICPLTPPK